MSDVNISEFNELQFKMIRIHKLQDQTNELWINPLIHNVAMGDFNYKIIFSILESLYCEVRPKCTPTEQKEIEKKFNEIEELFYNKAPFEKKSHPTNSRQMYFNQDNWKELRKQLSELNYKVRDLLEIHGFSPNKNSVQGL